MGENQAKKKQFYSESPEQVKRERKWLLAKMKQHAGLVCAVCALGIAGTCLSLGSSVISKYLVDAVTDGNGKRLFLLAACVAAVYLTGLGMQLISGRVGASAHIRVRDQLQLSLFDRILHASWQKTEEYQTGDLMNRLNGDSGTVADGVIGLIPGLLSSGLKLVGAFGIILYFDPVMALLALVAAPVTAVLSRLLMGKLRQHDLAMKEQAGEMLSFQEDSLRNLTSIKAFSASGVYHGEMERAQKGYRGAYLSYNSFRVGMSACISLVGMAVSGVCIGWGIYRLWEGAISYGSLVLFLQLASMLRSALSSLLSQLQQSVTVMASAGRLMEIEALPEENAGIPDGFSEETELEISLRDVTFGYRADETVLDGCNFQARPGEIVAVTGASGEGKTTLLRLLLGLVEPREGSAELIGRCRYTVSAGTRQAFSYVPQGNSIFSGTVAHNLRIAAPQATDEELRAALETACAWEFTQQLGGLEHQLGVGGQGISEGQAQRLAIARALLRKAPVLLLDEATSALDEETERQLLANLQKTGSVRTCILVTHRAAAAAACSREYRINDGRVTEVGHGA